MPDGVHELFSYLNEYMVRMQVRMNKRLSAARVCSRLLIEARVLLAQLIPYKASTVCCIMLAKTETESDKFMTQLAIDSITRQRGVHITVILVESGKAHSYTGAACVRYHCDRFNYNVALKHGFENKPEAVYDFYAFLNNDVIAESNCFMNMCKFRGGSVSPQNPLSEIHKNFRRTVVGFNTTEYLCGWCVFMSSDVVVNNIEVLLPDEIPYYCQDTWMAECIRFAGVPHYLLHNAKLLHIGGASEGKSSASLHIDQQIDQYNATREIIHHRLDQLIFPYKSVFRILDSWIYRLNVVD
jgi:hypothetical protein